jgi:hypothetical protein
MVNGTQDSDVIKDRAVDSAVQARETGEADHMDRRWARVVTEEHRAQVIQ